MNRRQFLSGAAVIAASPLLPDWVFPEKVILEPKLTTPAQLKSAFPQVMVYVRGFLQRESIDYEVVKHGKGAYTVEFFQPVADASEITVVAQPADENKIAYISNVDRNGAQINEQHLYYES